jgi:hypothetical protein
MQVEGPTHFALLVHAWLYTTIDLLGGLVVEDQKWPPKST